MCVFAWLLCHVIVLLYCCSEETDAEAEAMARELEEAAENIVQEFEQGMAQVMDNLEKAQLAFDDLSGTLVAFSCTLLNYDSALTTGLAPIRQVPV